MVELIKARIAFYGGREQLIKDILREWYPLQRNRLKGFPVWSTLEIKHLGKEVNYADLKMLSEKLGRSKAAIRHKACNLGIYKKSSVFN